jgi:superfamily II DNA/RNA helicase
MSATNELSITGGNLVIHESFDTMGLSDELLHGIYANGFEKPSRIQKVAILPMKERRDILAQSQSGTGKTGTFVIGALAGLDPKIHAPQVLVISPTRELSQQTEKVARAIGNFMKTSETHEGLKVLCATGGVPVAHDQRALRSGVQFVVGTPGRIFDLIRRGDLKLHQLKNLILDEADQLLDTLFLEQIEHILQAGEFAESTRLALFSATMPESVVELAGSPLPPDAGLPRHARADPQRSGHAAGAARSCKVLRQVRCIRVGEGAAQQHQAIQGQGAHRCQRRVLLLRSVDPVHRAPQHVVAALRQARG